MAGVIAEVGDALRALYAPLLPDGVAVRFGPPVEPARGTATISFFLASIREDNRAVPADWQDVRDATGRVLARRPPIRRFDLLYLVTAWTGDDRSEQALLDVVLSATSPTARVDPAVLGAELGGADTPVFLRVATDAERAYAALRLPPHTVLGLEFNAPLIQPLLTDIAPPAEEITLGVDRTVPPAPRPAATPAGAGRWRRPRVDEHPSRPDGGHPPRPGTG